MEPGHPLLLILVEFEFVSLDLVLVDLTASLRLVLKPAIVATDAKPFVEEHFIVLNRQLIGDEPH